MTVRGSNFIRNSNGQLCSRADLSFYWKVVTAWKPDGSCLQDIVNLSGFTPSSNQPTIYTSDTKQLENESLVYIGDGHFGFSGCHRVYNLVKNASFSIQLPFDALTPPASYASTALPVGSSFSGLTSIKSRGPDGGWLKTDTLNWAMDDFDVNRCPGSKRVFAMRKGATAPEYGTWTADDAAVRALRGRRVSFGAMVRQKTGSGGPCLMIDDGVTQSFSSPATGSSFVDANNNNYQFLWLDHTFDPNAPKVVAGLKFTGAIGDVCYMGGPPTLKYGTGITQDDLEQPQRELIDAFTHSNPPHLDPFRNSMPGVEIVPGSGLYGYCNLDIWAMSYGQIHHSLSQVKTQIEHQSAQTNVGLWAAPLDPTGETSLAFGPKQFTQFKDIMNADTAWLPFRPSNGYKGHRVGVPGTFSLFSNVPNVPMITEFDIDHAMA